MTTSERVVALDGVELTVFETGVGGRPLLLVHGYTGRADDFSAYFQRLADAGWHVVAPDLRGHGSSGKPTDEADYSLDIFAADLIELVDHVGFDHFVVLGHSMGGMITQKLVLASPDRIDGVILMDTSSAGLQLDPDLVAMGVEVARTEGIDVVADIMRDLGDDDPLANAAYKRMVAEDPSYAERGDRNLRAVSPAMWASILQQMTHEPDRLESLASISAPTLVLVGELDLPFLDTSRRMAEVIPGARLDVLSDGGHSPQYEAPEAWWASVSGFLTELDVELSASAAPA
jgi:pimeloyl-ACP methyl ester carboxylesterase